MLTANAHGEAVAASAAAGYLTKPITAGSLLAEIARVTAHPEPQALGYNSLNGGRAGRRASRTGEAIAVGIFRVTGRIARVERGLGRRPRPGEGQAAPEVVPRAAPGRSRPPLPPGRRFQLGAPPDY